MALRDVDINRRNLRYGQQYGTPYLRQGLRPLQAPQAGPQNWWQWLTPWKEEQGETFGQVWQKPLTAFGAAITSPFTPSVPGTEGLPWLQREEAEYEKWEEPTFTMPWGGKFRPTKGIVETLPFFAGGAALGAVGKLGAMAARGGIAGRAAGLGAKALQPAAAVGRAERAITGAALKGVGAIAKPIVKPIGQALRRALPLRPEIVAGKLVLPTSQMLDARFVQDAPRSFAQWAQNKPILNRVVRALGGESAFVRPASGAPKDIVLKELVKRDVILGMRSSSQGFYMPKLQRYGDPAKLLKISPKGVVGAVKQKAYLYDVLENPKAYTWLDKTARQYVDDLRGVVDDVYKLAEKEGVKTPRMGKPVTPEVMSVAKREATEDIKGEVRKVLGDIPIERIEVVGSWAKGAEKPWSDIDIVIRVSESRAAEAANLTINARWRDSIKKHFGVVPDVGVNVPEVAIPKAEVSKGIIIHRIVRGKTTPKGFEASDFGSFFERERYYKTMKEGVEAGMDYGLNPNESVMSTINHYIKRIADERLKKAVRPFRVKGPATLEAGTAETAIHPAFMRKAFAGKVEERVFTKMRPGVFPKEVTQVAEKYLKDEGQNWLRAASGVSGTMRLLVAAMDFSAPFIQGLPILGRRPDIWAKATARHYGFFFQPKNLYKYMSDPKTMSIRAERILHGGSSSPFEFFEALAPLKKGVTKVTEKLRVPQVGKVGEKLIEQTYGRAEAAFTGFGEMSRNEMWAALKRPNMAEKQLNELATVIDRMTGTMSTEALGIGLSQRQFESAFGFFAPRYTRAGLTLVSDIFKGGLTGAEARKSLGGMMAGGATMYFGICKAMGQEPNFDPTTAEFMTIKVGEDHIGIGGVMTALARLGADVIATTQENPMDLFMPFKNKRLNRWDNPFIRFLYSRTAPLTSLTIGAAVENADYFGRPMENLGDWARFLMDKVTPIAAQRIAPWAEEGITPLGMAGEVAGMRTWGERKIVTPEQQKRLAYVTIEAKVWAKYGREARKVNEEVKRLEREDKYRAKRLLMQHPEIVMARRMIDAEKKRWLMRNRRALQI